MTAAPLVAVTGGTGFVGHHAVAALRREGWRVRLLTRQDTPPPAGDGPPPETVRGDLADPGALRRLVAGADAVVHLAGLTKARTRAGFLAVNRDGTARLAAAVADAAPRARLLLVSSLAAREPHLSPYAESKRAGERAGIAALGAEGHWTVLRPCVVYGPGDRDGLVLRRMAAAPLVPVPRRPEPRIAFVHARDLADAVAALCRPGRPGDTFEITDERHDGYGWREILHRLGGRAPRFLPLPDAAFRAAGTAADAWAALTGRPALFGRGKAREILHRDWASDPARQPPPSVWTPRIPLADGLRDTAAWWAALDAPAHG